MKKKSLTILLVLVLVVGLTAGSAFVLAAAYVNAEKAAYKVNNSGQTYGNVDPNIAPVDQVFPELIAAIGIDGTEGYVYASDLDGEQPSSPEEAIKYMENLDKATAAAKAAKQEYLRYIPLYKSDGVTVIGQFGISYGDSTYSIDKP